MKKFLKENLKPIIILLLLILVVNIELPYYIEAPGGTINLSERINEDYDKKDGSLNMLYVTGYRGNVVTFALAKIINTWDIHKISEQQISDENQTEIHIRNKVMLDNSIQNATFVAYNHANIKINIKSKKNIVIATTKDNGIEIINKIISKLLLEKTK